MTTCAVERLSLRFYALPVARGGAPLPGRFLLSPPPPPPPCGWCWHRRHPCTPAQVIPAWRVRWRGGLRTVRPRRHPTAAPPLIGGAAPPPRGAAGGVASVGGGGGGGSARPTGRWEGGDTAPAARPARARARDAASRDTVGGGGSGGGARLPLFPSPSPRRGHRARWSSQLRPRGPRWAGGSFPRDPLVDGRLLF